MEDLGLNDERVSVGIFFAGCDQYLYKQKGTMQYVITPRKLTLHERAQRFLDIFDRREKIDVQ